MISFNIIPNHWKVKQLGDLCSTTSGGTPSRKESSYYNGNIPWVKSGELNEGVINETEEKITDEALKNSSAKIFPKGTLLIALYGATIGKMAFLGIDASTNQAVCGIFKSPEIESRFLFYFLFFSKPDLLKDSIGGAQPNISQSILKRLLIPVPQLFEQRQIVDKIEELFSELDAGRWQLETVRQQLKTYRQSVLKYAFEGKLTNNNVKNGELPAGWRCVELKGLCNKIQDGSHFSPQMQYTSPGEERYKYITAKNIRNNHMDLSTVKYVDKQFHDSIFPRCNPEFGDVLLTKDGVNTGEITLNTLNEEISLLSSVCLFKTNKELLSSAYLKYYIQSPFGSKIIDGSMTGTAIKRIILRKIKEARIVLPPITEQQRITQEIESRFTICDKLEETIDTCLQQSEALKQSILKQAFEGKLVKPQNT